MVDWLSNWAQGIIVAVVVATLIELILPNGNARKYVKVVIGIYILFTIISPIISKFKKDDFDINEVLNTEEYEQKLAKSDNKISTKLEDNNSRTIKDIYIANLKTDIKSKLKEKGYDVISTNIKIKDDKNYTIEKINLDLRKMKNMGQSKNDIESVNVEITEIQIDNNNTINNSEANNNDLTDGQKLEIKEYISKMYDIDKNNIEIS